MSCFRAACGLRASLRAHSRLLAARCHPPAASFTSHTTSAAQQQSSSRSQAAQAPPAGHAARRLPQDGLDLSDFVRQSLPSAHNTPNTPSDAAKSAPEYSPSLWRDPTGRSYYVETYGCQMNVSDSEIVSAVLRGSGMEQVEAPDAADVVLVNTCSIRDGAERKVWARLGQLAAIRRERQARTGRKVVVGVLGCMAERLKSRLLEQDRLVDLVAGPDAYRDLPRLVAVAEADDAGEAAVNTLLSMEETYADITPVRTASNRVSSFVSIMRGCDNMCAYCIVPFTRGRERSRDPGTIVDEVRALSDQGFKEVTLLGQNVNSYNFIPANVRAPLAPTKDALSPGFVNISRRKRWDGATDFTQLLDRVSGVDPEMRIRFTSPHPKDFPADLIDLISERTNICKQVHLPAQSGSTEVLRRMRRGYSREVYLDLIRAVRGKMPDIAISSDFISGFCGETEQEHEQTLELIREVGFDFAFMFAYSEREKTHAHRTMQDDVPADVKSRRLRQVIDTFHEVAAERNKRELGKLHLVLVEGNSKKSDEQFAGRTDTMKRVNFVKRGVPTLVAPGATASASPDLRTPQVGDYVIVRVTDTSSGALRGEPLALSTASAFFSSSPSDILRAVVV